MFMPTHAGSASAACAMPKRSKIETISTSVVLLNSEMNSLVMAGSAIRSACGSSISRVMRQ